MNYVVFDGIVKYRGTKKHFVECCTFCRADGNDFGLSCWTENEPDEESGSIKMNSLTHALQRADEWTEVWILEVCLTDRLLPSLQGLSICLSVALSFSLSASVSGPLGRVM